MMYLHKKYFTCRKAVTIYFENKFLKKITDRYFKIKLILQIHYGNDFRTAA